MRYEEINDLCNRTGLWINFANIDPIKALVYTATINGIVAVPIFITIMKIANDRKILNQIVNGKISNPILLDVSLS